MEQIWQRIRRTMEEQKNGCLVTIVNPHETKQVKAATRFFYENHTGQVSGDLPVKHVLDSILEYLRIGIRRSHIAQIPILQGDGEASNRVEVFFQPLEPPATLLILGGGHIAQPLVSLGKMMGFQVTVVDDRPSFANKTRFPEVDEVICADFKAALRHFNITQQTYVVVVTRGHRHDQICVQEVLDSPAAYVGMVGSKRRVAVMRGLLQDEGLSPERLDKLHSPIGIDIGAETPAEIALSIMGEVVMNWRKSKSLGSVDRKKGELEIDSLVIDVLVDLEACVLKDKAVLATIIEVKGSAPRKPGAQMLFYADGRTVGTIGGGCAEAKVRCAALSVLDQGTPLTYTIDLSNDIAADEGMACGGTMKFFLAEVSAMEHFAESGKTKELQAKRKVFALG